jgi:hypothetical protein
VDLTTLVSKFHIQLTRSDGIDLPLEAALRPPAPPAMYQTLMNRMYVFRKPLRADCHK